ncbi:MAG: ankyrin repeat domain-containing protein, partial [Elusimicrobiota bacterium]|nr:ankyrin repeat domain-containing protein [Elusimicrobiota bacterium]
MDTKTQKIKMEFAKHKTNGFILDLVVKSLGVEQKESKYQKIYQRFVKEEDISSQEYYDTLNTTIEDILCIFCDDTSDKHFIYFEKLIKEFLNDYNRIKLKNESLQSSQKQLDFIALTTFFIPFLAITTNLNGHSIVIDSIIPVKNHKSTQKLFDFIHAKCPQTNIKKELYDIFKSEKYGYNSINKLIDNWINGKSLPNKEHIRLISKLSSTANIFSENQLNIYFNLAKIVQCLIDKLVSYLGEELTEVLVLHWKLITSVNSNYFINTKQNFNIQDFDILVEIFLKRGYEHKIIRYYFNLYYNNIVCIFDAFHSKITNNDLDINVIEKYILECERCRSGIIELLIKIDKNQFFDKINIILPVKYFTAERLPINIEEISELTESKNESFDLFLQIYELTFVETEKTQEMEKELESNFKEIETKYEVENNPYFNFCKARYYAQKRQYKTSAEYYLKALRDGKNCIGGLIEVIIKEGLFVSAQTIREERVDLINAKSPFTKFYKAGYLYKLLDNLPKDINAFFLNDMKKQFDVHFRYLYPGTKQADKFDNNKKINIDIKNPNKKIKDISQLIYFVISGDFNDVELLVKNGADVNYIRVTDNFTALIATLGGKIDENKIKIAKFLIPQMSKEAINATLIKKQDSALSHAINKGLTEIVELLIKSGVDLKQRLTLDALTPLYLCLMAINMVRTRVLKLPSLGKGKFIIKNPLKDENERKKILRMQTIPNAVFDDEKKKHLLNYESSMTAQRDMMELAMEHTNETTYTRNLCDLYKVFDIILSNTCDINALHRDNFTVLTLAVELNEEELVKKIIDKGGD